MTTITVTGPGPAPEAPAEDEPAFQMFDHLGNPVCPGCHEGPLMWAARQNSRMGTCGCPAPDRRMPPVETRADALWLLRATLDVLDEARHHATCACVACRARRVVADWRNFQ